ncbi:MAG: hypothetical protein AAF721_17060 [Myxococcota bacterium]
MLTTLPLAAPLLFAGCFSPESLLESTSDAGSDSTGGPNDTGGFDDGFDDQGPDDGFGTGPDPVDGGNSEDAEDGSDEDAEGGSDEGTDGAPALGGGAVTFFDEGAFWLFELVEGAQPQNVSELLEAVGEGEDVFVNIDATGQWLVLDSQRIDPQCAGNSCLAVADRSVTAWQPVLSDGSLVFSQGATAIGPDASVIVYEDVGPHDMDLFAVTRVGAPGDGSYSAPILLTGDSAFAAHHNPAIAPNGDLVAFECEDAEGRALCEVAVDGTGFTVMVRPTDNPGDSGPADIHHPSYAPDGSLVFEAAWPDNAIWRAGDSLTRVGEYADDNSPCVLADGNIVSLWTEGPDNPDNLPEIKLMSPDGASFLPLVTGIDIDAYDIGCGG